MKNIYQKICVMLLGLTWALSSTVSAQNTNPDTLLVPWLNGDDLAVNSLYNAIVGDTIAGGARKNLNRVYKLQRGGFYYLTEAIENGNWPLRIVGEKGDPTKPEGNPPMLQLEHRPDGSRSDKLLRAGGSLTLKNMIINGKTTLGDLPYETIQLNAADAEYVFDNVTFEYAAWGIMGFYGKDSEIYITNSRFRNLASRDQPWGGRGLSIWVNVDKLVIENNTFMNIGGFGIQLEGGVGKEVWINHNTFVNVGRQVFLHGNHLNTYFTNNLIVNGFYQGEGEEGFNAVRLSQPDNQFTGLFNIEPLPSIFGLEIQRKIVFSNNSNFREKAFEDYYTSTANVSSPRIRVRSQPFINVRAQNFFNQYPAMVVGNLIEGTDPGLKVKPNNASAQIAFIEAVRSSSENKPEWYWDPGRDADNYSIQWPFPEDFTYTSNVHLSGAFGNLPLGDLNWHPAKKTEWLTKKADIEQQIKALTGGEVKTELVASVQAEDATLSGSAKKVEMGDRFAVRVAGSGDPSFNFTLPAAGNYTVFVKNRTWYSDNNPNRETNLVVNGTEVGKITVGREITANLPWGETSVAAVPFKAGLNTIKLGKSWGYVEYLNIVLKTSGGEVVKTIWASQATNLDGAEFHCAGVLGGSGKLCASGDAYLDLTGGSATLPLNVATSGDYIIQFKGSVLGGGTASTTATLNGSLLGTLNFETNDSSFVNVAANLTRLSAGANTLVLSGVVGKLGIDDINVYKVSGLSTSLDDDNLNPNAFNLSQNYPNPFNPSTNIQFNLPTTTDIKLTVHNVLGQTVAVLADGRFSSGTHMVQFNGKGLASGMYFYRLQSGNDFKVLKMTLIK